MGVRGARTSETSTTQSWLARCSGGMYDSTHSLTCLIAALRKREAEGRLVSRVSVGRIAVRDREDLRKLDAKVPRGERRRGFWARVTHPLLLFGLGLRLVGQLEGTRHDFTRALFHTTHERMAAEMDDAAAEEKCPKMHALVAIDQEKSPPSVLFSAPAPLASTPEAAPSLPRALRPDAPVRIIRREDQPTVVELHLIGREHAGWPVALPEPVHGHRPGRPLPLTHLALHPRAELEPQSHVVRRRRPVRGFTLVPVLEGRPRGHALVESLSRQLHGLARKSKRRANRTFRLPLVDDSHRGVYGGALGVAAYDLRECGWCGWGDFRSIVAFRSNGPRRDGRDASSTRGTDVLRWCRLSMKA